MNIKEELWRAGSHAKKFIKSKTTFPAMGEKKAVEPKNGIIKPAEGEKKEIYEKRCEEVDLKSLENPSNINIDDVRKFTRSMFYLLGGTKKNKNFSSKPLTFNSLTSHFRTIKDVTFNKNGENNAWYITIKINQSKIVIMPYIKPAVSVSPLSENKNGQKKTKNLDKDEPTFIVGTDENIMINPNTSSHSEIKKELVSRHIREFYKNYKKSKVTPK